MMFLLRCNIGHGLFYSRDANAERAITFLPFEFLFIREFIVNPF
jgi:hypothetical protein